MEEKQLESKSPVPASPVITKPKEMKFSEAIDYLLDGKKIHKLEWKDKEYYAVIDNTFLKLHKPDGKLYDWRLNDGDLAGEDFIIL